MVIFPGSTNMSNIARCFLFGAIISGWIVSCMIFLTPVKCAAKEKKAPDLSWMKIQNDTVGDWIVEISSEDKGVMKIVSNWKTDKSPKKVLALVPKKSGSYKLAMNKFLEVFHDKDIPATVTLLNWGKDNERASNFLEKAVLDGIDLVFSMGSESANFVYENLKGSDIPVVTCTNKDPVALGMVDDAESGSGTNIAYTSLSIPIDIQMSYIRQLKPDIINIGLMYNKNHKQVMATEVKTLKESLKDSGINIVDVSVSDRVIAVEELKKNMPDAITMMKQNDPLLENSIFWVTSSTAIFANIKVVAQLSENIPILGSIPNIVTDGLDSAVMAIGIDRRNNAHIASQYAADIIEGKVDPGSLKVGIVTPPDVAINFGVVRQIGIKIPFNMFESAAFVYDYKGRLVREFGQEIAKGDN